MAASKKTHRAGRTAKVSVSIARDDLALLRARAKRLYQGNISAVVAEGVARVRQEEGRQALLAWLGEAAVASPEEREAIRAELRGDDPDITDRSSAAAPRHTRRSSGR